MLKVTKESVIEKLGEYGYALFSDYPTEDQGYCFQTRDMIIFLDEVDDSLAVTFQATVRPEDSASRVLILSEIEHVSDISVMESFIYDKDNNFVSGKKAHDSVKYTIIYDAFREVAKQKTYNEILENVKGFEC